MIVLRLEAQPATQEMQVFTSTWFEKCLLAGLRSEEEIDAGSPNSALLIGRRPREWAAGRSHSAWRRIRTQR